jgi:hypothetical protein
MNRSLKHLVVLFTLLVLSGQNAYSNIPSLSVHKSKQCLVKDQNPASAAISDVEDEAEDNVKSTDHSLFIIFSHVEISITGKSFSPIISALRVRGIKKNILHAVFRI